MICILINPFYSTHIPNYFQKLAVGIIRHLLNKIEYFELSNKFQSFPMMERCG